MSLATFSVIINGVPVGCFGSSRGLRQGVIFLRFSFFWWLKCWVLCWPKRFLLECLRVLVWALANCQLPTFNLLMIL